MPFIRVGEENSGPIEIYYEDHGVGNPVVLIHGWPLSGASWEKQTTALTEAGHRVITYDRRGFGKSSKPFSGYDYRSLTQDLDILLKKLDLKNVTLVGFSMGNGEVVKYLGAFESQRISRAVFIAPVAPFLLRTENNPEGVKGEVFDHIKEGLREDRPSFLMKFLHDFYKGELMSAKVSTEVLNMSWNVAVEASPKGTLDCVSSWLEDFRGYLAGIELPTLVIQGDSDRILPIEATGRRLAGMIPGSRLEVIKGAPHGLIWTHAKLVNGLLLDFLVEQMAVKSQERTSASMTPVLEQPPH